MALTTLAEIPVVPLPPAPIRPVGRQADVHPLLVSSPWLAAGALFILISLLLLRLRSGALKSGVSSGGLGLSNGPQVKPIRDPKYWKLILQAELESHDDLQQQPASQKPGSSTTVSASPEADLNSK